MRQAPPRTAALIIPALNEEAVIGTMLGTIPAGLFAQIIVADNGSTDRTAEVAQEHGATVVRTRERGYGIACLTAMEALDGGIGAVAFMQADCSENPEEARLLLAPIYEGRADLVLGSRTLGTAAPGALLRRQRWGNRLILALVRVLFGRTFSDLGPFRAVRADALRELGMRDHNYGWTVEMQVKALRRNYRILEIPVSYGVRIAGEHKVSGKFLTSVKAGLKMMWVTLRLRWD